MSDLTWLEVIAAERDSILKQYERQDAADQAADRAASEADPGSADIEYTDAQTGVRVAIWFKTKENAS